jgi:hypothetical protein
MERNFAVTLPDVPRNYALLGSQFPNPDIDKQCDDELSESIFAMDSHYALTLLEIPTPRNDALTGNGFVTPAIQTNGSDELNDPSIGMQIEHNNSYLRPRDRDVQPEPLLVGGSALDFAGQASAEESILQNNNQRINHFFDKVAVELDSIFKMHTHSLAIAMDSLLARHLHARGIEHEHALELD